ncbi:chitin binding peritrophin-A domain-containing protein [Nocardia goodfellowii]|uniref:Chitin-binding type-2 domain-containing protein n=2 Tax=Nocardia goodfellowii TaxID=882446 RepID=A0ABS4Q8B2_9NOCA|nr:hypothetical protein [Nocardia goodfellowii]
MIRAVVTIAAIASCLIGPGIASAAPHKYQCPKRFGVFTDPDNKGTFYVCHNWRPSEKHCPKGLHFNSVVGTCDRPKNVPD